jgi:hypothetical protein
LDIGALKVVVFVCLVSFSPDFSASFFCPRLTNAFPSKANVFEHDASIANSSIDMRGLPQHAKDKTAVVGVAISPTSRCARHESEEQNVIDATCRLLHLRVAASHRQCLALQRIVSRSLEERMQMDTDTADADANDLEAGNVHEEEQHRQPPGSEGPEERPASAPAPSTRRPGRLCCVVLQQPAPPLLASEPASSDEA